MPLFLNGMAASCSIMNGTRSRPPFKFNFAWSKLQGMKAKSTKEVPKEYTAFKDLLRKVVKVEAKPVSAPAPCAKA